LLLGTGQRRSDVVRMGWQHLQSALEGVQALAHEVGAQRTTTGSVDALVVS